MSLRGLFRDRDPVSTFRPSLPAAAPSTGIGAGCSQVGDVEARLTQLKHEREELLAQGKMSTERLP
jgi:hypothetical protein